VGRPLTIFIDEYPAIAAHCPGVKETFLALAREGAKPRMRLVVLTQDANVETLGISGQGAVRSLYSSALVTARKSTCRGRPRPVWGISITDLISAHSASVRSVA
jgi:hypothetical protein